MLLSYYWEKRNKILQSVFYSHTPYQQKEQMTPWNCLESCSLLWNYSRFLHFFFLFSLRNKKNDSCFLSRETKMTMSTFFFFFFNRNIRNRDKEIGTYSLVLGWEMTGKFCGFNTQHLQREEEKSHKKLKSTQPTLPTGKNIGLQDTRGGICMCPSNTSQETAICHVIWLLITAPRKIKGCPLLSHTFTLVLPPWKGSVSQLS